jgi:hypothetical protein
MTFAFNATVGGASANSYCTVEQADAYLEATLWPSAWASADTTSKQKALASATSILEREAYIGYKTTSEQRLAWPRLGAYYTLEGRTFDPDEIPRPLIEGVSELAKQLLGQLDLDASDPFDDTGSDAVDKISVGPIDLSISSRAVAYTGLRKYPQAWKLISTLLSSPGGVRLVPS